MNDVNHQILTLSPSPLQFLIPSSHSFRINSKRRQPYPSSEDTFQAFVGIISPTTLANPTTIGVSPSHIGACMGIFDITQPVAEERMKFPHRV